MDWRFFVAELVKALSWPGALVAGLVLLRRPITDLLGLLTELKYGKFELRFAEKVRILEEKAATAFPSALSTDSQRLVAPELAKLAEHSPRAAVIEAWIRVKEAGVGALKRRGVKLSREKNVAPQELENTLREHKLLDNDQLLVFRQMRTLRNAAVHGPAFSLDSGAATQYAVTAQRMVTLLERGKDGQPTTEDREHP